MKSILYHLYTALISAFVVAGHFAFTEWLFGQTTAVVWLISQFVVGAWMAYELIRAPVYDD